VQDTPSLALVLYLTLNDKSFSSFSVKEIREKTAVQVKARLESH
jgi:hypothetical protein